MKLRHLPLLLLALLAAPAAARAQAGGDIFPYPYTVDDLPNGLRLVTIPTDYPNLVSLYIVVQAGSRNEVEPGKSGFAHFFEHIMFRGSKNFSAEQRFAILKRAGASANAYTDDDRTVYHETFSKADLDAVMRLEADRFQNLEYPEAAYRTEALAILGEYNKNSASPVSKLYETMRATAFRTHTYRHTTMGFLEDIQAMPEQYEYSRLFYDRFYRPEYTTIVLVGDVQRAEALRMTQAYFGEWKRGSWAPQIPAEPAQTEPRTAHVDWPTETPPWLAVAFRGPAYSDEQKDDAALDLLAAVAFSENSPLYRRLVLEEQKVDQFGVSFDNHVDGELFALFARVKDPKDVEYVRDAILAETRRLTREPVDAAVLAATRSNLKYSFALQMNSSNAIADAVAPYVSLRRTPDTINRLYRLYDSLTPADLQAAAAKYFVDSGRTIATLATKTQP